MEQTAQVLRVLEEYLAGLERGGQPRPDLLLARHPDLAEQLKVYLEQLDLLHEAAVRFRVAAPPGQAEMLPSLDSLGQLGDFQLLREVARGGMGIVYEAEQISLRRRVALKVLPLAGALDPRRLQRFQNEARAAASLHHEHIIPVYAVGCERGVHFYAMQFIEGCSLAQLLKALRPEDDQRTAPPPSPIPEGRRAAEAPTPLEASLSTEPASPRGQPYYRRVAELIIQAALALEHAHSLGIVHRDVKPGNLLVDQVGKLWVGDFGLARLGADAGLTLSGDLLGTLRYMAPEQALARHGLVDHRADIYGLGATLYELLTLRSAVTGTERAEIVRQVAFEEAAPPRRFDRAIPMELETITLKCLAKNPGDRYPTAAELAEDLRRWQTDQPIRARRPAWRQVALQWTRRHKPVVWAVAAVLLVAVLCSGAAGVWWLEQRVSAEGEARALLREARRLHEAEKWSEAINAVRHAQGVLAGVGTDPGLRKQAEELGRDLEMVTRLQEARLRCAAVKDGDYDWEAGNAAYAAALHWYGLDLATLDLWEAEERLRRCSIRMQLVMALDDWADHQRRLKINGWKHLVAVTRLADPDPWRNRLRDALEAKNPTALEELLASAHSNPVAPATAVLLASLTWTTTAERTVVVLQQVQQRHPGDFWINEELGGLFGKLERPQLDQSIRYHTAAVALRPQSSGAHVNLGAALQAKGDLDGAIREYQVAVHLTKDDSVVHFNLGNALKDKGDVTGAIKEYHEAIRLKKDLPEAHNGLGIALQTKGDVDGAIREYQEALRLKKNYPDAHNNLGAALKDKGDLDGAIREHQEALRLKKDFPGAHNNLGNVLLAKGDVDGAIKEYQAAIRLKKDYPLAHNNLGVALQAKGDVDGAIREHQEALRLKKNYPEAHHNLCRALMANGDVAGAILACQEALRLNKDFPEAHCGLGVTLHAKGDLDGAIKEYQEALRLKEDFPDAHNNFGNALRDKGDLEGAIKEYQQALRLKQDYAEASCNLGIVLRDQGQFSEALKALKRGHNLGSQKPNWALPSAQWVQECQRLVELDAQLQDILDGKAKPDNAPDRMALAEICYRKRLHRQAVRFFEQAFADQHTLASKLDDHHRYDAACNAALSGCGEGKDAPVMDSKERAHLRKQALDWLRADLTARQKLLAESPEKGGPFALQWIRHCQHDRDFARVRDPKALAKLPAAERQAWQQFWVDVADTLTLAQQKAAPPKKSTTK
jgi:tetratricopeptide (TPR) repeat protein